MSLHSSFNRQGNFFSKPQLNQAIVRGELQIAVPVFNSGDKTFSCSCFLRQFFLRHFIPAPFIFYDFTNGECFRLDFKFSPAYRSDFSVAAFEVLIEVGYAFTFLFCCSHSSLEEDGEDGDDRSDLPNPKDKHPAKCF